MKSKVSKERIGIELGLVLRNSNVIQALTLYHESGILPILFDIPPTLCPELDDPKNLEHLSDQGFNLTKFLDLNKKKLKEFPTLQKELDSESINYYLFLSALHLPFQGKYILKKKTKTNVIQYLIKESVKVKP